MLVTTLPVWIAYSFFNYNTPDKSVLNVAYPSAISYYFITVQSKNNNLKLSPVVRKIASENQRL